MTTGRVRPTPCGGGRALRRTTGSSLGSRPPSRGRVYERREKRDQQRRECPDEVEVDPVDRCDLRRQQSDHERGSDDGELGRPVPDPPRCEQREHYRGRLRECLEDVKARPATPDAEWRRGAELVAERGVVE